MPTQEIPENEVHKLFERRHWPWYTIGQCKKVNQSMRTRNEENFWFGFKPPCIHSQRPFSSNMYWTPRSRWTAANFFSAFQVDLLTRALLRMDFQSPRDESSSQLCHPLLLLLIFILLQVFYVRSCCSCDRRQTLIGNQLAIAYSPELSTH